MEVGAEVFGLAVVVYPPAKSGVAAYQVDGLIDAQVDEGLGEVVHGLVGLADGDEDLAVAVAQRLAHGLVLELTFDQGTAVHQRVLAEEIAFLFGGLFEKRRVFGGADGDFPADDGAVTFLRQPPGQRLAFQDEGAEDFAVVGTDVGGLEGEECLAGLGIGSPDAQARRGVVGNVDREPYIVDGGIKPFGVRCAERVGRAAECDFFGCRIFLGGNRVENPRVRLRLLAAGPVEIDKQPDGQDDEQRNHTDNPASPRLSIRFRRL